jgi:catechol 2,3-dioxygenase-like lactoylglutathione lyase family enzyme
MIASIPQRGSTVINGGREEGNPMARRVDSDLLLVGSLPAHSADINVGGGPTDDKPTVTLTTPPDPDRTSAFMNLRVADIAASYAEWSAKGAEFLTEPKVHATEIRAYIRDPDGHLIEVGQSTVTRG